ncbi:MAG TPA: Gfo/Idh/MocA family oxidoreductase, partial [Vicinamibacterales bacterium]|nr:Gfo/Idh/MocA family oxidoreductase [Vicinamibacterales bacterium]
SRRRFVTTMAGAGVALTIVPRHVLGRGLTPPSDLLNVAGVGVGGMGRINLRNIASENIVAMCDVDWSYAERTFSRLEEEFTREHTRLANAPTPKDRDQIAATIERMRRFKDVHVPKAARYRDYREMLEKQKDIDAVLIATPDHTHAVIASAAMDLGKHVYVQKPLTATVREARVLAEKARQSKVVTQMGNQGHSWDDGRLAVEHVRAGTIGRVREVHVWTNRPLAYWPQGIPRPTPVAPVPNLDGNPEWNMPAVMHRLANAMGVHPPPQALEWDLFLGPAPFVEYHPVYHPFNWRGWVEWGNGAIGDMGAHLIDHAFWALDLGYPTSIETVSTPFNGASYPMATTTYFEFPARGARPAVKLTWYDGGLTPPKPPELEDEALNPTGGALFVGTRGKLLHDTYGLNPRLLPATLQRSAPQPPRIFRRIPVSHEMNWVNAAKGLEKASTPFEYAAQLTEVMLLGIASLRAKSKLHYDGEAMRVTNVPDANHYLHREYRQGWSL